MTFNKNTSAQSVADAIDQSSYWGLFQLKESLRQRSTYWQGYLGAHHFASLGAGEDVKQSQTQHALARLEWMLDEAREQISGLFSREEFALLAHHVQGDFNATRSGYDYAAGICTELQIDFEHLEESEHASLLKRLLALTASQSAALSDAIEVGWHSGPFGQFFDTVEELGISFK
ncbi:MAG: hypothetical protein AABZ19_07545 [Pseudomonadota bacterium]